MVLSHSIHLTPASVQSALRGSTAAAEADHAAAVRIADTLRAAKGQGLLAAPASFAAMVAVVGDTPAGNSLVTREALTGVIGSEQGALKAALTGYDSRDTITVEGPVIVLDNRTTGRLTSGATTFADSRVVFYVTADTIVGIRMAHAPLAHSLAR